MSALRILVGDDHEIVRRGVCALLATQAEWEVVGEAANGRQALEMARRLMPDVVVLDLSMPELNGLAAIRALRSEVPAAEILVFTQHESEQIVHEVLAAGARGFLLKSDAGTSLLTAVDTVSRHLPFFTGSIGTIVLDGYLQHGQSAPVVAPPSRLTPREREIVQLLAEGKSNKEVAGALGVSVKTAETHRTNVMRKLQMHSVTELVRYAVRNGIIEA